MQSGKPLNNNNIGKIDRRAVTSVNTRISALSELKIIRFFNNVLKIC
jgi:hypothetical protein